MGGSAAILLCLIWFAADPHNPDSDHAGAATSAPHSAGAPSHSHGTVPAKPADGAAIYEPPRYRIDAPTRVLNNVPIRRVVITALTPNGEIDAHYEEQPYITGIRLSLKESEDAALGAFHHGVLELTTDLEQGRKVFLTDEEIVVDPEGRNRIAHAVRRVSPWWSILPLVVVIGLAFWLRNALVPLFLAIFCGSVVLAGGNILTAFFATFDDVLFESLVPSTGPQGIVDYSHLHLVGGIFFLGALGGVVSAGGGLSAAVARLGRFSRTREQGQLFGCLLGVLAVIDQTAQLLVAGTILRPVADRLKISREKLAFVIDSAGGSLAAIFIVSLGFGSEFSAAKDFYARHGMADSTFTALLTSIPFRFYPIYLFVFALLVSFLGRDFGPMLRAEARALKQNRKMRRDAISAIEPAELPQSNSRREWAVNFLVPVMVFFGLLVVGAWWAGQTRLDALKSAGGADGPHETTSGLWGILTHCAPSRVLFFSSFTASLAAIAMTVGTRALSLSHSLSAWLQGARSVFLPLVLLVLAWGMARLCDESHLNTVGFLVEIGYGHISPALLPALGCVLAALIAFATGSQIVSNGLLLPLFIAAGYGQLVEIDQAGPTHQLIVATIGAVTAGSLFGRQCSLFGNATIIASAGAGSDHYDHVFTQVPYALSVATVSLVLGVLPAGMGYSPGLLLPLGTLALFALVQFLGRPAESGDETDDGPTDDGPTDILPNFDDVTALTASAVDDMLKEVGAATAPSSGAAKSKS